MRAVCVVLIGEFTESSIFSLMIYLIGGPPRVGKSRLARKITREKGISSVSTDVLNNSLDEAFPQLGIRDGSHSEIANRFFPFLEQFVRFTNYQLPFYTVEGDTLYPHIIHQLQEKHEVRACCLGNRNTTRELLLAHTGENDWVSYQAEEEQLKLAEWVSELSGEMEQACHKYRIPYFEMNEGFEGKIQAAFDYLIG